MGLLLDKEVIFREDLEEIFGKRPYEEEERIKIADLVNPVRKLPEESPKAQATPDPPSST